MARSDRTPSARGYSMGARQSAVDDTRLAITEATVRLHERVGPRATTVSAIADEAHVTRLTVYRHFPDQEALVLACSTHWGRLHPRPDPSKWTQISDPVVRLRTALGQTYRWAGTAAPMMRMIHRDVDSMPGFVGRFLADDQETRVAAIAGGFRVTGRPARRLAASIAHALRVSTWESLCTDGRLTDAEAIDVMVGAVLAATQSLSGRGNDR